MSISASLANALSGLTAVARGAEVVSSNVSNALTEGYGRREIELGARNVAGSGSGVRVLAVNRAVDPYILGERRIADAEFANQDTRAQFRQKLQNILGQPDDPGSLTGRFSSFDAALIEAASRPDSVTRLDASANDARALADRLNFASDSIQGLRMEADQAIKVQVDRLNTGLAQVQDLNIRIRANAASGREINTMLDQRQILVDELAQIVPMRVAQREGGQIALYTTGGSILLDGPPADITFAAAGVITPDMTAASGALGNILVNGNPVTGVPGGRLAGGSLGAAFEARDVAAVAAQADLDAIARDLIERFASPTIDPTLMPGDPGLFTDAGTAFVATDEIGIAGRIRLNALVDPTQGGDSWRMRDGLGAPSPGNVGDPTLLYALSDALTTSRIPASGSFSGASKSASGLAGEFISKLNAQLVSAQGERTFSLAQRDVLKSVELQNGVDSDEEMQKLLLLEQAYAANAKVVSSADEMLQQLLRL